MAENNQDFEAIKRVDDSGREYWSARDLMPLLGYGKHWRAFEGVIQKAMISCLKSGTIVERHFTQVRRPLPMPHGGEREGKDYDLWRLACYLIALNADPRKPEVAAVQGYIAVSTRKNEMNQQREEQEERLIAYRQDADATGVQSETEEDLATITFIGIQAEEMIKREYLVVQEAVVQAYDFVGEQVRKALENVRKPLPEDIPSAATLQQIIEERNRAVERRRLKAAEQEQLPALFDPPAKNELSE
jgi:hypothetical protein